MIEKSKRDSMVISRVGTCNRVVLPKEALDALALNLDDKLLIQIDSEKKRLIVQKLSDAVQP